MKWKPAIEKTKIVSHFSAGALEKLDFFKRQIELFFCSVENNLARKLETENCQSILYENRNALLLLRTTLYIA